MKIGDKVTFKEHIFMDESGRPVHTIKIKKRGSTISKRTWAWEREINENSVWFHIRKKEEDKEISGIYIGSIYKKLHRGYKKLDGHDSVIERLRTIRNRESNVRVTLDQHSKNPNRLDNAYKLDEIAIIATSKTKRYMVEMKHLINRNLKERINAL